MILVTGGTGLVGAHLLYQLVKSGHNVRAIYRDLERTKKTQRVFTYYAEDYLELFNRIEWVAGDILDITSLNLAFKDVTAVYHAAAFISFDPRDRKKLMKTNVEGTSNIVNLCVAHKIKKLCYTSSIAAIGPSLDSSKVTENNDWIEGNNTDYANSKYDAEMEVWRGTQEGVPAIIVNPGVILGPGYWKTGSGLFFHAVYKGQKYYLPNGTGFVGVNDVAKAMIDLMDSTIKNERYILVSQNISFKKITQIIAKGLKKPVPKKELSIAMLGILWRLDWVRSKITGKRRRLSKTTAEILRTKQLYDNSKIKEQLTTYNFEDLEQVILECCAIYLVENSWE